MRQNIWKILEMGLASGIAGSRGSRDAVRTLSPSLSFSFLCIDFILSQTPCCCQLLAYLHSKLHQREECIPITLPVSTRLLKRSLSRVDGAMGLKIPAVKSGVKVGQFPNGKYSGQTEEITDLCWNRNHFNIWNRNIYLQLKLGRSNLNKLLYLSLDLSFFISMECV